MPIKWYYGGGAWQDVCVWGVGPKKWLEAGIGRMELTSQNWWEVGGWSPKQAGLWLRILPHTRLVYFSVFAMLCISGFPPSGVSTRFKTHKLE